MPESLADGRSLLALDISPARRKQLGQCFTGLRTGKLLAALAVRHGQKRFIDPMAGHGDLLESASERASLLHFTPDELIGVEIEPTAAKLGVWRVEQCAREYGFRRGHFIHGDAFAATTWEDTRHFDLVITNPPYVRYQTLSNGVTEGSVKLLNTEATRLALERLAVKLAPPDERLIWQRLIGSYSGLADLSVPSWLLCGLLTAPSGVLALVVPQTWLNREYARIARYFFLRFFQPLAIIQESGQRWFRDALVPISLVVGRRLFPEQAVKPLRERNCKFGGTPFAEVDSTAASPHSHVGNAFRGNDPEGEFAQWLEYGGDSRCGVKLKRVSWESQRDEVLAVSHGAEWLRRLEGDSPVGVAAFSSAALPASIMPHLPADFLRNSQPLSSETIRVGQGLRTGCNAFFYVDLVGDAIQGDSVPVLTSELLGRQRIMVPASALKTVLRKQTEFSGIQIVPGMLRGRLVDLRCFVLPENDPKNGFAGRNKWFVMPEALAEYVRLAARTYLVRGETRVLIPCLSAVKPNGLGPGQPSTSPSLLGDDVVRMWYMVPDLAPRHRPSLCVPRIIHDEPNAILNAEPPVLIDANFSTLWSEGDTWSAESVFAVLNSTWGELCMEALGATLGGGALKLEATHLRQLPIPRFSGSEKESLRNLVRETLDSECTASEFRHHRAKIDRLVVSALARRKFSVNEATTAVEKIAEIIRSLRAKRRRHHNHETLDEE